MIPAPKALYAEVHPYDLISRAQYKIELFNAMLAASETGGGINLSHPAILGEHFPVLPGKFNDGIRKHPGWRAGDPMQTLKHLDTTERSCRRMVFPPENTLPLEYIRPADKTQERWLTECCFAFARAAGFENIKETL